MNTELKVAADLLEEASFNGAATALRAVDIQVMRGADCVEQIGELLRQLQCVNGPVVIDSGQLRELLTVQLADIANYATDPETGFHICADLQAVLADQPTGRRNPPDDEFDWGEDWT